ncbi:MAG: flippase [Spirochaetales bacterium]|nr:flippase [Spirochaetales bacterium]
MNIQSRFYRTLKNIIMTLITQGTAPFLSLILIVFIARSLGVSELGKFTFLTTLFTVFQVVSALSFNFLITREIAQYKTEAKKLYASFSLLGSCISLLFIAASGSFVMVMGYSSDMVLANWIIAIGLLPSFWTAINEAVFMVYERNELITTITIIENAFKIVCAVVIVMSGRGIVMIAVVLAAGRFLNAFIGILFVNRKFFTFSFSIDFKAIGRLIKDAPVFSFIYSLSTLFISMDVLMLSKIKTEYEVGLYTSAYKIAAILKILSDSIVIVLFPLLSDAFKNDKDLFRKMTVKVLQYLILVFLPISLMMTFFAKELVLLFFGHAYVSSTMTLQLLIWAMFGNVGHSLLGNSLMAGHHQKDVLKIMFFSTILNGILNYIFIMLWNYDGAAFATLVSSNILFLLCVIVVNRRLFGIDTISCLVKPFVCIVVTGIPVYFLVRHYSVYYAFLVPLLYFPLMFLIKGIGKEDIRFIKRIVKL